jgi:hypothetical protein
VGPREGRLLRGQALRNAVLTIRASTLDTVAADAEIVLSAEERQTLREVAKKLRAEASALVSQRTM